MNYGKVEGRSSSQSQSPNTAKSAATSAILTDILSKSGRAPPSLTVDAAVQNKSDFIAQPDKGHRERHEIGGLAILMLGARCPVRDESLRVCFAASWT